MLFPCSLQHKYRGVGSTAAALAGESLTQLISIIPHSALLQLWMLMALSLAATHPTAIHVLLHRICCCCIHEKS